MASSGLTGFSSGAPGSANNRSGSTPYPTSPAESGVGSGTATITGSAATASSGTAAPALTSVPYGVPARSGAIHGTAGSVAGTGYNAATPSLGKYTGAAAGRVVADSLAGVALAVAGLAFLL